MSDKSFASPVYIKNGSHLVQEIHTLDDALDVLEAWPGHRRGPIFETARRAVEAAATGRLSLGAARNAFAEWARLSRLLQDITTPPAWTAASKRRRGGIPT